MTEAPACGKGCAQFAMRIPADLKMKHGRLKHVTRTLGARYLPKSIVERPKKGFGFPLALWLQGPLRRLMQRTIDESRFVAAGVFQRETIQRLLDEHVAGSMDHNYRLWMIFNLEMFWRVYIDGEPVVALEDWIRCERAAPERPLAAVPAQIIASRRYHS